MTETPSLPTFFQQSLTPFPVKLAKRILPNSMLRYLRRRTQPPRQ
ncbi:hypothetical protein [Paracoccus yeei]